LGRLIEGTEKVLKSTFFCSSSLREEVRRRETPAITGHLESLTPTLSLRERGQETFSVTS